MWEESGFCKISTLREKWVNIEEGLYQIGASFQNFDEFLQKFSAFYVIYTRIAALKNFVLF